MLARANIDAELVVVEVRKNVLNVMVKEDVVGAMAEDGGNISIAMITMNVIVAKVVENAMNAMARELSGAHLVKAVALIGVINVMELVL